MIWIRVACSFSVLVVFCGFAWCFLYRPESRPYQHLLTTVERVDEPEDALRVYHDRVRGVTCYAMLNDDRGINCLADSWLKVEEHR